MSFTAYSLPPCCLAWLAHCPTLLRSTLFFFQLRSTLLLAQSTRFIYTNLPLSIPDSQVRSCGFIYAAPEKVMLMAYRNDAPGEHIRMT